MPTSTCLPSGLQESVSLDRCRKIAKTIIESFMEDYKKLSEALDVASLPNFRAEVTHLLESRLQEYQTESHLYDMKVSAELKEGLKSKLFEIMKCLYEKNIWQISNDELKLFKNCTTRSKEIETNMKSSLEEFEKKCAECAIPNAGWSCSQVKQSLEDEMKNHQLEIYKKKAAKTKKNIELAVKAGAFALKAGATVVDLATGFPVLRPLADLIMQSSQVQNAEETIENAEETVETAVDSVVDLLDSVI